MGNPYYYNTRLSCRHYILFLFVVLGTIVSAQNVPVVTGRGNGFLQIRIPESTIYDAAIAESTLTSALQDAFTPSSVRCIEMKEADDTAAAIPIIPGGFESNSTFVLLFLIGENILTSSTLESLTVDLTQLRNYLQFRLGTTPSISIFSLSPTDVTGLGTLAALGNVSTPTASSGFLRVNINYRNLLTPANLTRSLVYQTRRGIARFLGLPSLSSVIASGPPQVPPSTVLLVTQGFYVILPTTPPSTVEQRERLANLLIYGDPSRLVPTNDASSRPSMFLDFVTAVSPSSPFLDPTVLLTLPYVFSSLVVEQLPPGNPPVPAPDTPVGTLLPATPTSDLLARMRKTQRFIYPAILPNRTDFPGGLTYWPSTERLDVSGNFSKCGTIGGGFCTHIVWNNTLDTAFWVESIASVEQLAWDLYPTTPLCTTTTTSTMTTPVPPIGPSAIVGMGSGGDTPMWTLGTLTGASNRMDFALKLRSLDDNGTALTVEIATDMRSSMEAASTVTSIARRMKSLNDTSLQPIYTTKSNIVVSYRSHFRNANEMYLFLTIRPSEITKKDDSQPCAHCQNVYDWCQAQVKCSALMACVVRDGLERAQIGATLLQSPIIQDAVDVSSYFRTCLATPTTDPTDIDALLLFSSAVRCQLQRMCPFRTPASYNLATSGGVGIGALNLTNRILLWESGEGRQVIQGPSGSMPSTAATAWNVTMKLGPKVLCSLPVYSGTTAQTLEDTATRLCRFANYLGRISVTMALNTATTPSLDQVEFRFRYLVGPMPTLEITPQTTGTTPTVVISALPALRLRLETIDFATNLPAVPPSAPVNVCQSTCRRLALDGCLRDLSCVAFTDCMVRTIPPNATTTNLGDAILDVFERNAVGETLDLTPAITRCHSQSNVNQLAWRKLVAASACYAKNDCPISLSMLVPSSINTVGKWRMTPATQTQRLIYQQLSPSEMIPTQIPIVIKDDTGKVIASGSTNSLTSEDVQAKLREVLVFDDIYVSLQYDSALDNTSSATALRVIQWTIQYVYWTGLLPRFIDTSSSSSSSTWLLTTIPTVNPDTGSTDIEYTLEMHSVLPWNTTINNGTWITPNDTMTFVELTSP